MEDDSHNNNKNIYNIQREFTNIKMDIMIIKLIEIIHLNNEPVKLFFLFLTEISNLFELHSQYITQDSSRISINVLYLDRVLSKIILVIEKFLKTKEYEICNIELEKIITILNNFYIDFSEIKITYLDFYIKFIYLCLTKTKFEVEFKIRKKLITQFFGYLFDIIQNYPKYEKVLNLPEDFIKLIEIIIIFLKNFGKASIEDIFIVFKMTGVVIKKINNENSKNISFMQLSLIYFLVSFICPIILS
jgi:hypothetical protein